VVEAGAAAVAEVVVGAAEAAAVAAEAAAVAAEAAAAEAAEAEAAAVVAAHRHCPRCRCYRCCRCMGFQSPSSTDRLGCSPEAAAEAAAAVAAAEAAVAEAAVAVVAADRHRAADLDRSVDLRPAEDLDRSADLRPAEAPGRSAGRRLVAAPRLARQQVRLRLAERLRWRLLRPGLHPARCAHRPRSRHCRREPGSPSIPDRKEGFCSHRATASHCRAGRQHRPIQSARPNCRLRCRMRPDRQ
jgi:hypothetical protein